MNKQYADRVILNSRIYTVDEHFSVAQAMAVQGKYILCVGSNEDVQPLIGPDTIVTDAVGKTITPGFIESHLHMNEYGNLLNRLDAYGKSKEQILAEIREGVSRLQPGEWFLGAPRNNGYDHRSWDPPVLPTLEDLDEAAPNNPVAMYSATAGVGQWVNTKMLEALGFSLDDPQVQACRRTNEDGSLTGCFVGPVSNKIWRVTSKPSTWEQKVKAYRAAEQALYSYGFTTIVDAANTGGVQEDVEKLYADGELSIRYYGCLSMFADPKRVEPEEIQKTAEYFPRCPIIGAYNGRYNVRTAKVATCGTIDNWGAEQYEPYFDKPETCGMPGASDADLWSAVKQAHDQGMQVMCHAIGEKGIDRILDCYQRLHGETPINDRRYRIEHYQLITGNSPERMKKMGIIPSMQGMHGPDSADIAIKRLGPDRVKRAYAIGMALQRIGMVIGSSDAPAATPRAMSGIHAMVTCTNDRLEPKGGFNPENAISVEDALRSYTIWGAYSQFAEHERGSLEAGKLADYVILDQDFLCCPPDDILKTRVLETVLEGETKFMA